MPVQPAVPLGEILEDEQSRANDYVIDLDDPVAGRITVPGLPLTITPPARVQSAAPELGAHTDEVLGEWTPQPRETARDAAATARPAPQRWPLEGVKVLDLGNFLAGPYGAMLLADLGADVIKLESSTGDQMRGVEWSFVGCQRGKRSVALDLKSPEARPALEALIRWADIVHHNLRMPAAHRLGVDYESVKADQPRDRLLPHQLLRATRPACRLARLRPALPVVVRLGGRGRRRGQPADVAPVRVHGPPVRALVGRRPRCSRCTSATTPARGSSSPARCSVRA